MMMLMMMMMILVMTMMMMMICFLPNGPQTRSAPGGTVKYDDDGDNDQDGDDDDVDDNNDDDGDTRCFRAPVPFFQGIENVRLLAVKLVLNLNIDSYVSHRDRHTVHCKCTYSSATNCLKWGLKGLNFLEPCPLPPYNKS